MDLLTNKEFAVPLGDVVIFVLINSFCILFGKYKLGLLVSYCFVFHWGFIFNLKYFIDLLWGTITGCWPIYSSAS